MEDLIISVGDPKTLDMDYESAGAKVYTTPTDKPLLDLFEDKFSQLDNITVALSGGLDSQFSANLAKKFSKNPNAVTFKFLWEGTTVNPADICQAEDFAKKIDLDLTIEEVDLQHIFTHELDDLLYHYRSISPQISAQVYALKNSQFKDNTLILGGEIQMVRMLDNQVNSIYTLSNSFHFTHTAPFALLDPLNGMHVIRDPFYMSPEILYQGIMHNIDVMKHYKKCFNLRNDAKTSTFAYKKLFYNKFEDFEFLNPLSKRTGFESLKFHLATESGAYDQFDMMYRDKAWNKIQDMPWATPSMMPVGSNFSNRTTRHKPTKISNKQLIASTINEALSETTLEECNVYHFDW